jgi:hypothetical protein
MWGTTANVLIWETRGPLRTCGRFLAFVHDGVHKARSVAISAYIGRHRIATNTRWKTLSDALTGHNDVHSIMQGWCASLHEFGIGRPSAVYR